MKKTLFALALIGLAGIATASTVFVREKAGSIWQDGLFIGDGALKCKDVLTHPNAHFVQCCPKASAMLHPAETEYKEKRFKDIAYFEPFYLKQFVATVSSKKLF